MSVMDIDTIVALCALVLLGAFIYGPWQMVCTDFVRQIIFEKRDAIFDMADKGELSFDSSEYRMIRSGLEGLIRFAHELTLPSLVYFWFCLKNSDLDNKPKLQLAVDGLQDPEVRERTRRLVNDAVRAAAIMMVVKSPLLMVFVFLPILIVGSFASAIRVGVKQCARAAFRRSTAMILFESERVDSLKGTAAA
jgi:hypothetical protein